jgi:hypothetical protein
MTTEKIDSYAGAYEADYAEMTSDDQILEIIRILGTNTKPMARLVAIGLVVNSPP